MKIEWTEEDGLRIEAQHKDYRREQIEGVRKNAEKKFRAAEENYNSTGSDSTYRTMQKYQDLLDVCTLAAEAIDRVCPRCEGQKRLARQKVAELRKARDENGAGCVDIDYVIDLLFMIAY